MNPPLRPAFINPLLPGLLLMVGATGAVGAGAVWARHQVSVLANENRLLEARIASVERESQQLDTEIAEEQDTRVLLQRQAAWKLALAAPAADHVQNIGEDPLRHLSSKQGGESLTLPRGTAGAVGLALGGR